MKTSPAITLTLLLLLTLFAPGLAYASGGGIALGAVAMLANLGFSGALV